ALIERVARAAREFAGATVRSEPPALMDPYRDPVPFEQLLGRGERHGRRQGLLPGDTGRPTTRTGAVRHTSRRADWH
ncbi:hypothetical protein AB0D38_26995, partial [Streptomyces sp. NPDC048279]|uniref:hypothetical protein n=1 Tax=Streptomyces sp. NPDC048279 TaxID=3154714 RepID=UPI0034381D4B